jgi:hypothetical protein
MKALAIIINGIVVTVAAGFVISFGNQFSGWGDGATSAQHVSPTTVISIAGYFVTLALSTFFKRKQTKTNTLASAIVLLILGLSMTGGPFSAVILFFATILFSAPSLLIATIDH